MSTRTALIASTCVLAACSPSDARPPSSLPDHGHERRAEDHHDHDHHDHHGMPHRFEKADDWVKDFDAPERAAWQRPDEVAALLALSEGLVVVDLGAGTGYFEPSLSRAVGGSGKVVAADVEPDMVRYLGQRAKREALSNVEPKLVRGDDPELAEASVDRVLVVDTWHHLGDREAYSAKLARALRPGGFVLVVDFTAESDIGPPREHRLSPETVTRELSSAGLDASVVSETLPKQFVVRATKKPAPR